MPLGAVGALQTIGQNRHRGSVQGMGEEPVEAAYDALRRLWLGQGGAQGRLLGVPAGIVEMIEDPVVDRGGCGIGE